MMDAIATVNGNREQFSDDFVEWLPDNLHVCDAFVEEAMLIVDAGFKHYSSKTIIHVIRHHSAIAEKDGTWKINNNHSPYLARLWALMYPAHAGLFSYRSTPRALVDTATLHIEFEGV
jgi:hypothetical protein